MSDDEKIIYRLDDMISFRQCDLANKTNSKINGDCTCFYTKEESWQTHYYCDQHGIHLHCAKHPEIELKFERGYIECSKCGDDSYYVGNLDKLLQECLKVLNIPKFKDAKLIRLDDWYVHEVKEKVKNETNYWITSEVKTDKDKDTMIVLYVGKRDAKEKIQFFIKPEKLQLTSDHKDLDPATILSKIEVTLKDRTLKQEYDKE